jgi:predicted RecB family nuclease
LPPYQLTKSRFTTGLQCHKLLWWTVHEPGATELQPDKVLQDLFDQAHQVGEAARRLFPGGVLIGSGGEREERVAATEIALASGAPTLFEAAFATPDVFVAVDVLQRTESGAHHLFEAKASNSQKEEHLPDVAIQLHAARASGVEIARAEVIHLNGDFRHPGPADLLARTDVTAAVEAILPTIPAELARQQAVIEGPLPQVPIGAHCFEPRDCPFHDRCWSTSRDHIIHLTGVGPKRAAQYLAQGVTSISGLPKSTRLNETQRRQIRALTEDRLIVEPPLGAELAPFAGRLGYLDFETVARAIPVWPGMAPWGQAAAQFSYHEAEPDGTHTHAEHLAEGPGDARPRLAEALVRATARADRVVVYTSFEKTKIRELAQAVPHLAGPLAALEAKLLDLHPVVKNHVYHPDFLGSFSLKYILTPLVPELTYNDLVIVDGRLASVEIARLLFVADRIPREERDRVRKDLLDYCERDTWAMVRLVERLRALARGAR